MKGALILDPLLSKSTLCKASGRFRTKMGFQASLHNVQSKTGGSTASLLISIPACCDPMLSMASIDSTVKRGQKIAQMRVSSIQASSRPPYVSAAAMETPHWNTPCARITSCTGAKGAHGTHLAKYFTCLGSSDPSLADERHILTQSWWAEAAEKSHRSITVMSKIVFFRGHFSDLLHPSL